jgi:hypothetical protein
MGGNNMKFKYHFYIDGRHKGSITCDREPSEQRIVSLIVNKMKKENLINKELEIITDEEEKRRKGG